MDLHQIVHVGTMGLEEMVKSANMITNMARGSIVAAIGFVPQDSILELQYSDYNGV
jgi:hypothetical protein